MISCFISYACCSLCLCNVEQEIVVYNVIFQNRENWTIFFFLSWQHGGFTGWRCYMISHVLWIYLERFLILSKTKQKTSNGWCCKGFPLFVTFFFFHFFILTLLLDISQLNFVMLTIKRVNYFHKMFHLKCFTGLWIGFWVCNICFLRKILFILLFTYYYYLYIIYILLIIIT